VQDEVIAVHSGWQRDKELTMMKSKESNLKDRLASMDMTKKVIMGAVGVMALAGIGFGAAEAASAASPSSTTPTSSSQSMTDTPTSGDTPDIPGVNEAQDTQDGSEVNDAPDPGEEADTPEKAGDTGPDLQQNGDHTDPGDLPDSP
jgi:hypothetical protein